MSQQAGHSDRDAVLGFVVRMLQEITMEWDVGPILPETRLGSLGLESINLVYLIAELQQQYKLQDLIRKVLTTGSHINDLCVDDVVAIILDLEGRTKPRPDADLAAPQPPAPKGEKAPYA